MSDLYSAEEQTLLLHIARYTLDAVAHGEPRPTLDFETLPASFSQHRACFVTLEMAGTGNLRGCTGTLVARRPLADEVSFTTVQTAFHDPRFPTVTAEEVPTIEIEISILTPSSKLSYNSPDELIHLLRPGIDGVTLHLGYRRSTFLPQVWDRVPDPVEFLTMLSRKMELPADSWRDPAMEVETYQTIIIAEAAHHARST